MLGFFKKFFIYTILLLARSFLQASEPKLTKDTIIISKLINSINNDSIKLNSSISKQEWEDINGNISDVLKHFYFFKKIKMNT